MLHHETGAHGALSASPETLELAHELQQARPDPQLVFWLINDREADLAHALETAKIREEDLLKKPHLRLLNLHCHLRRGRK